VNWRAFNGGATLGGNGSESGVIVLDEAHDGGARITLERDCPRAPFAITCGVYGLLVHTRFFATEAEGRDAVAVMKPALAELADAPLSGRGGAAANAFVDRFP
jgi:hypothetical protein